MTNVSKLKTAETSRFCPTDQFILKLCANWKVARAQQEINWAQHSLANNYGTADDTGLPNVDCGPLQQMKDFERHLAEFVPGSALAAREMLRVALEILAYQHVDADGFFADGPVLEIVRHVGKALDGLDPGTRMRPAGVASEGDIQTTV